MPSRVLLGHIAGAHGIRGAVLIKSYTGAPEAIASYGPLSDERGRSFELEVLRITAKGVIAQIRGVSDRTTAEALKGVRLWAERSQLPPTAGNEYYHSDLIGLEALSPEGERIGEVLSVQNYGAGDLLEIRLKDGGKTELLPFADAFVPEVDIAGGRLIVILPQASPEPEDEGPGGISFG
jgi:16S rRNA processing protein RimM